MEKLLGLVGYPLSHSFSERYFAEKFAREHIQHYSYKAFPISNIDEFPELLKHNRTLIGLNVTIPYKETIIAYLDKLSPTAQEVGAVNTITISRKGSKMVTTGYNTDVYGFFQTLKTNNVNLPGRSLILGTGGASKAVEWVLKKHGCTIDFVSRNPQIPGHISYQELNTIGLSDFNLIVNTTPLGMYPHIDHCPTIPYETATEDQTFFDLIYNPAETLFLKRAAKQGAKTINGLYMLEQQAEKAWEIWNTP